MVQEFHYEISWRARSPYPGHHRGVHGGAGFEFRGHAPLLAAPDPRRLDIHASLRDPFERWLVRIYSQRSSIRLFLVADLSASMGFHGTRRKLDVLAALCVSAGYSAYRTGDAFGFIGCDDRVRADFLQPPTRAKGAGAALARRLQAFAPTGRAVDGLLDTAEYLGRQRALVLLASDFHFPLELLARVLEGLARHHVVPVVIWDRGEFAQLPRFGFALIQDSETGARRTVFLRAGLREKIAQAFEARRAALTHVFHEYGVEPLFLTEGFHADLFTDYFLRRQAGGGG